MDNKKTLLVTAILVIIPTSIIILYIKYYHDIKHIEFFYKETCIVRYYLLKLSYAIIILSLMINLRFVAMNFFEKGTKYIKRYI